MQKTKRSPAQLLQVAQLGNAVLRKKTKKISNISDEKVQQLIDAMIATCLDVDGVGIAAPQVYQSLRLFIVASRPNPRYPYAPNMKPLAVINPKIIKKSEKTVKDFEGCLSIPGIRGSVPRHESITIEYLTSQGIKQKKIYRGFVARIFQHEYDHIDEKVFLDRIENMKDLISEKEFKKIIQKKEKQRKKAL